jgi:hypothetical protein
VRGSPLTTTETTSAQGGTENLETATPKPESFVKRLYKRLDKGILALCLVFVLTLPLFTARIYASDEIQYVSYLHSIVFDFDLDFTNEYETYIARNPKKYEGFKKDLLDKKNENGLPINTGPVGSAILWSPFYVVAHGVASLGKAIGLTKWANDGYSFPYEFAITFASLLYGFIGLILAYLFIRNFIPRFYASLATIVVWLASPVIFYLSLTPPMSHANSLFMISLWLYVWYRTRGWRIDENSKFIPGQRSWGAWFALGLIGGLMTMVREQDGTTLIVAAIEALYCYWLYYKLRDKQKPFYRLPAQIWQLFGRNLLFLGGLILAIVPQFVVYYFLNGRFGPTKIVGDKLNYLEPTVIPQFLGILFHPDHGMFWWSPILLLAVIGLIMMLFRPQLRFIAFVLIAAYFMQLYISAGFQTWSMRGSFGARRLVGISPAFIAGLAYLAWWFVELSRKVQIPQKLKRRKVGLIVIGVLFIVWNVGVIFQFSVIRDVETRKYLNPPRLIVDQFTVVPGKIIETAGKFFTSRSEFYQTGK